MTEYEKIHLISKSIVAVISTVGFIVFFVDTAPFVFVFFNFLYFFGVNTVAHIIEKVNHYKNQHKWL